MRISDWSSDVCSSDLKVPVQTGNLVYALFQHDTSRALDPQGHIHAVIGNMTQMPDGKWQALHADKIWSHKSIIGAIYHSYLRTALEQIGDTVELHDKPGHFELLSVLKDRSEAFRQRTGASVKKAKK